MSAFVVDPGHIDYLVSAALLWQRDYPTEYAGQRVETENATEVGKALIAQNIASCVYLYPRTTPERYPVLDNYQHRMTLNINPLWVLSAIRCYTYQSCEDPEWEDSPSKAFCDDLQNAAIGKLPGMDDAPWEITRDMLTDKAPVRLF